MPNLSPNLPNQPPRSNPHKIPPHDAGSLPDNLLNGAFSRLNPDLPLLLLPVRLETRFDLSVAPPVLHIRVYPDQIHIDSDYPQPSQTEQDLTRQFWQTWYAAGTNSARNGAWEAYVHAIGSPRAGYLARLLRPAKDSRGNLDFPVVQLDPGGPSTAHPTLLPERWLAVGYGAGGQQIFSRAGLPIDPNLRTAPQLDAPTVQVAGGDLALDEGLAWMFDYPRALQCGMAVDVPLTGDAAQALDQVSTLLVFGLVTGFSPIQAADELARLLNVHARSSGLAFVPQGTPTNNTETTASGWTPKETDLQALFDLELGELPAPRPQENAARLAWALGLANPADFQRLANGADLEGQRSQQMRTVLFEAVLGSLLRQLLRVGSKAGLTSAVINDVRAWFINHVTGGAPIPTLRIGAQPYGILPVRKSVSAPDLSAQAGRVEQVVNLLIDTWRQSAGELAPLTKGGAGAAQEEETETAISVFLAAQPHPARLFIRRFEEYIAGETAPAIQITYDFFLTTLDNSINITYMPGITELAYTYQDKLTELYPNGFTSIDDQIDIWKEVQKKFSQTYSGDVLKNGMEFSDTVLYTLSRYEERQHPLRWLDLLHFNGVIGKENTRLVAGLLYSSSTEWGNFGLVQAPEALAGQDASTYLLDLHARFKNRTASGDLATATAAPAPPPLLYQLLDLTLALVPNKPAYNNQVLNALKSLAGLDAGRLEWLLRETLGLGAHRLDAWASSLATERLERQRQKTPLGLQIGAFGWLTNLSPRQDRLASRGFVHAPSMGQAVTAAVLRAGWQADGGDDPLSPLSVNLDSQRVRTAAWLLDGVRQGQPLGSLLGSRFERSLHDHFADDQIWVMRQRVLAAQKRPQAILEQPVDGMDLLDLYRAGQLGAVSTAVGLALADLEAAFDAVQDAGLYESVHQALSGSFERASAMLDALSTGALPPPEMRAADTPRAALTVEQRLVILLPANPPAPAAGWQSGLLDRLAPALDAWAASLLPPPAEVGFKLEITGAAGSLEYSGEMTLAELQISALDALYLSGGDPQMASPAICTLAGLSAHVEGSVRVDPVTTNQPFSLADFTLLAVELRTLLETLRPLDGHELAPPAEQGEIDADLSSARLAAIAFLRQALARQKDLAGAERLRQRAALRWFAQAGIASGSSALDEASLTALQVLAAQRTANLAVEPTASLAELEANLAAFLQHRLPMMGQFVLDSPVFADVNPAASAEEMDAWFDAASRVHPAASRLFEVAMLSELFGAPGLTLWAGQTPREAGEGWAANSRPAGRGRLAVMAVCLPDAPPQTGQKVCGLLVEQWNESIPSADQVTGVTFHYDAPASRPPQSWLLAVTPDQEPWSLKLVADTLLQTLEWAALRAVGPEDLLDLGRAIPTTFLPGDLRNWPKETTP